MTTFAKQYAESLAQVSGHATPVSYTHLKAWMQHLQDKYKKLDAIVGIEPTGHYWFDLGAYLEDEGILLVMVCLLYTSFFLFRPQDQ